MTSNRAELRTSILVVENHPDLRAEIVATLQREHYECEGVSSGEAAMLKIRDHEYRYVLLDVDAETAAGNLFESLSSTPETRAKIVLLTDGEGTDDLPDASGCVYVRKPFDTKQLLSRLRR